jgi:hypothetical protein
MSYAAVEVLLAQQQPVLARTVADMESFTFCVSGEQVVYLVVLQQLDPF